MTREQLDAIRSEANAAVLAMAREHSTALFVLVQGLQERIFVLENAMVSIERRLREDAAPLVTLVNAHGGPAERKAWKAVYSSAITAQIVVSTGRELPKEAP